MTTTKPTTKRIPGTGITELSGFGCAWKATARAAKHGAHRYRYFIGSRREVAEYLGRGWYVEAL